MSRAGRPWEDLALARMGGAGGAREARTRPGVCGAGGGGVGGAGGGAGEAQGGVWVRGRAQGHGAAQRGAGPAAVGAVRSIVAAGAQPRHRGHRVHGVALVIELETNIREV